MKAELKTKLDNLLVTLQEASYPRRYTLALKLFPEFRWIVSDTTKDAYAKGYRDAIRRIKVELAYDDFQDAQKKKKTTKPKTNK
jgi:hypothetical protein